MLCFCSLWFACLEQCSKRPFTIKKKDCLKIYYFNRCIVVSSLYPETNILAIVIKIGNWETLTVFSEYGHLTWELLFPAEMSVLAGRMEHILFPRNCQTIGLVELADNVVKSSLVPPCCFVPVIFDFFLHCHLQKENINFSRLILHVSYCVMKCLMHLGFQNTILKYIHHLIFEL